MKLPSYPLTLAAAKKNESSLWDIGDALLKECPPDNNHGKLAEVSEYLIKNGCDYVIETLRELRAIANQFPKARRRAFSFSVHQEAATPAMLDAIINGAPKGIVISVRYVRKIVAQIRDQEERERRDAFERAQAKREAAEAEQRERFARKEQAKTEKERKRLRQEHHAAVRRTEEAKQEERAARVPPKKNLAPPQKEEMPVLAAEADFVANAAQATILARKSAKVIADSVDELTPKGLAALTESGLEAANAWRDAVQVIRKVMVDERGHLSVVEN